MEKWGFVFGEMVEGDDLFRHAELPAGWKKVGSDHAMWSYIHDDQDRPRVAMFYKAAFYDRDAFARLESRYTYTSVEDSNKYNVIDRKTGAVLHTTAEPNPDRRWDALDEADEYLKKVLAGRKNDANLWDED